MAEIVVLFFLFKFKVRSAFEYASKCSFFHTHAKSRAFFLPKMSNLMMKGD